MMIMEWRGRVRGVVVPDDTVVNASDHPFVCLLCLESVESISSAGGSEVGRRFFE